MVNSENIDISYFCKKEKKKWCDLCFYLQIASTYLVLLLLAPVYNAQIVIYVIVSITYSQTVSKQYKKGGAILIRLIYEVILYQVLQKKSRGENKRLKYLVFRKIKRGVR